VYCNYFRYGQCHTEIANTGPIACRVVSCVPPYESDPACETLTLVDNATAEHAGNCSHPVDPNGVASLLPAVGGAAAAPAGTVHLAVRGTDGAVWWNHAASGVWAGWQSLGGGILSDPVLVRDPADPGALYLIVRGKDYAVWMRHLAGGAWGPWTSLGGVAFSDTAAAASTDGVYVFVRDQAVSYLRLVGGAPAGTWRSVGGSVTGSTVVATHSSGESVGVVARGAGHDLLWGRVAGNAWSGWSSLGGTFTSDPALVATSWGFAVCGRGTDERLLIRRLGGAGGGWTNLPGQVGADPTLAVDPADSTGFYVFSRGISNETYVQRGDATSMGARTSLGGQVITDTVAVADPSGLFLFGQGTDSAVWANRYSGGSWSGWASLGFTCLPIRAV